jgi:group II intron reverse transcriptase/maturase
MERMLERGNMTKALKRVEANAGAPGVDGLGTKEFRTWLKDNWEEVKGRLLGGNYIPMPVRRVRIPKPDGKGKRMLGIPTVLDRLIQQALLQVLEPIFDPSFSESSYGFRPGRRGHDAVRKMRQYAEEGYRWVVDIDLEKYFDTVNHDILMSRVARKVTDKRVLRLIRKYLQAGAMDNGVVVATSEGTPQGGPLSPLLANILLDDLDKELEKRGHRFCRYADDQNVYVKSKRAGLRVMASVRKFLETRLKLKVNDQKSAVGYVSRRKFLGFSLYFGSKGPGIKLAPKSVDRVKAKIRDLTGRNKPISMEERIKQINQYLRGWLGYFALADAKQILYRLQEWLRHRLRACQWIQWKRVRTKYRELKKFKLPDWKAHELANTRKGPWRTANGPLNSVMTVHFWRSQGLIDLVDCHWNIRENWRNAGCRTARPVL